MTLTEVVVHIAIWWAFGVQCYKWGHRRGSEHGYKMRIAEEVERSKRWNRILDYTRNN